MERSLPLLAWALLSLAAAPPVPLQAQEGSAENEAAAKDERLARADSVRATLVQPPGDRGGLTTMDVIRAPFRLFGGSLAVVLGTVYLAYDFLDDIGLVPLVLDTREELSEAGVQVGVDFIGSRSWPALVATIDAFDPFYVEAGYSVRRYELYGAGLDFGDETEGLRVAGRHHVMREPHFWGVGPDSEAATRSDFMHTRTEGGARAWSDFGGPVRFGVGGGWERTEVGRGSDEARPDLQDVFDSETLFGATQETTFLRWDAEVDADFTTVQSNQRRGVRLIGGYHLFRGLDDTDADFHRATADLRAMAPLGPRHVLALRVLATDHLREGGRGVPFTHLAALGDDDGLRGHRSWRFRDRALLAGQAELRYEAWWHPGDPLLRLEGFAFADYGAVGSGLSEIDGGDFELTPGLGLRFTDDGDGVVETFIAWGGDVSPRLSATLGVTF